MKRIQYQWIVLVLSAVVSLANAGSVFFDGFENNNVGDIPPVGTGACCVSHHDSCSGIKSLQEIEEMLANQWKAAKTSFKSKSIQII